MIFIEHNIDYKPLSWKGINLPDNGKSATLTCSNGHTGSLETHTIRSDGSVSPSVVCPHEGCDFHQFVLLEEWKE